MNPMIIKKAIIFSLIFGAMAGLVALLPFLIGYILFCMVFFASIAVILYMKKDDKYLGIIDTKDGAILGGIIGFFANIGFFISFAPMVCILKLLIKSYYAYAIPDAFSMGAWLFFIIVFMISIIFAMTNSASGMALAWIIGYFEKKPEDSDARMDIKIED